MKRNAIFAALAIFAAGSANAAVTELVLYKGENFKGASQTVKGEVNNLEGGFARSASSAIVRGGNWEVCTGDHFRGNCYVIGPGEYPSLDRNLNQQIVSVRFVGNNKAASYDTHADRGDRREGHEGRREGHEMHGAIDLYARQDFRGRSIRLENNERDLSRKEFDGRASSVIVQEGVWELCSEPGFAGRCETFRPGQYRYLAGLDERVSSARQVR
jgi:hypothetical protein